MLNDLIPEEIKPIYSEEVKAIIEDVKIRENLKECQELRDKFPNLKKVSSISLIRYALEMYARQKKRILRNKLKRGLRNGKRAD
jgi:hypothetical protein